MAENKKSFILYADQIHMAEELTDEEAGRLYKHLLRYVNDMNPEPPDRITKIAFEPIKQQLKRDFKKYETIKEKRTLAGKASAESRQQNQHLLTCVESVQQTATNPTDNVNVNVNGNVNGNVNVKEEEYNITTPPTPKGEKITKLVDKTSLNYRARIMFEGCYKSMFENTYYWTAKDAGQMAQLIKKLSFQIKEKKGGAEISDDEVLAGLDYLLKNINDRWILENYTVTTIATKFNEIISQIKNGNKKNIRITSEKDEREFIDAVINGVGRAEYERNQRVQWGGG